VTENTLTGKVALVTGGSKGIGRAIAVRLAENGVKVAINYNSSEDAAENLVRMISESGGVALKVRADVSNLDQVKGMISNISNEWGGVNILVNNAGIIDDRLLVRMSDDSWQRVIDVNLNGTFYTTRSVLKDMMRERWGRIINIGSVVALRGNPAQTNYTASKAAIIGFTKALAKEVATRGITVNVIAPGYFETETTSVLSDDQRNRWLSLIPQGHFGDVNDVAHMAAYLADDKANYVTGQVISVDGGMAV
tara:strand:- start:5270 stop:6022 length:753 start_codon:yes stop_codon:yes gene_type:complete